MADMALGWNLATLGVLSLGGPLVGWAVFRKWHTFGMVIAILMACWAGTAAAAGQASFGWKSCGVFAAAYLTFTLVRWSREPVMRALQQFGWAGARYTSAALQRARKPIGR